MEISLRDSIYSSFAHLQFVFLLLFFSQSDDIIPFNTAILIGSPVAKRQFNIYRTSSVPNVSLASRSVMTSPMMFDEETSGGFVEPQPHLRALMSEMLNRTKSALQEGQEKLERTCHMIESQREECEYQ